MITVLTVIVKLNRSCTGRTRHVAHFPATDEGRDLAVALCSKFNQRHPRTFRNRGPHRAAAYWVSRLVAPSDVASFGGRRHVSLTGGK
jgi:hypothetical protein